MTVGTLVSSLRHLLIGNCLVCERPDCELSQLRNLSPCHAAKLTPQTETLLDLLQVRLEQRGASDLVR